MSQKPRIRQTDEQDSEHWKNRRIISIAPEVIRWVVTMLVFAGFTLGMYKVRIQATIDKVDLQACEMRAYNDRLFIDEKDIAVIKSDVANIKEIALRTDKAVQTLAHDVQTFIIGSSSNRR